MISALDSPIAGGLPVLGNSIEFSRNPAVAMADAYRKYGPVFRFRLPGHWKRIALAGPEICELLAKDMAAGKQNAPLLSARTFWEEFMAENGASDNILAAEGHKHRDLQAVMRKGYHKSALHSRMDTITDIGQGHLDRAWAAGQTVSVLDAFQRQATHELGAVIADFVDSQYVEDVRDTVAFMLDCLVTKQRPKFFLMNPRYKNARRGFEALVKKVTESEKPHALGEHRNLVRDIFRAHLEQPELIKDNDLLFALGGPFFAGLDTEANTMAATLYGIVKYENFQDRAAEEAQMIMNADDKVRAISQASFLQNCILEGMRLWPISAMLMRTSTQEFEFEGFEVPADTTVFIGITVPHFLEDLYPNPMRFNPDRDKNPKYFGSFGQGTHICLGRTLAMDHMVYILARLLSVRKLSLITPDYELKLKTRPTPGPAKSFKLRVENR